MCEFSIPVPYDLISEENYNLDVKRYVLTEEFFQAQELLKNSDTVKLEEIADIIKAQSIKSADEGEEILEANPRDIDARGYIKEIYKTSHVDKKYMSRIKKQKIKSGDILLTIKGSVGRVGLVADEMTDDVYAGQAFVIVRLKKDSLIKDPVVLYRYFRSELAKYLLETKKVGATVQMIKMQDIANMQVIVPGVEEQENIISNQKNIEELHDNIELLNHKVKTLENTYWSLN